jgi:hypothetical protein
MVMVPSVATDVRALSGARQRPDRARRAQQLDRSVHGGQPESWLVSSRAVVHLDDRERAFLFGDCVEDRAALRRPSDLGGKLELGHPRSVLRMILSRN